MFFDRLKTSRIQKYIKTLKELQLEFLAEESLVINVDCPDMFYQMYSPNAKAFDIGLDKTARRVSLYRKIFLDSSPDCCRRMGCQRGGFGGMDDGPIGFMCLERKKRKFLLGFLVGHTMFEFKRVSHDTLSQIDRWKGLHREVGTINPDIFG